MHILVTGHTGFKGAWLLLLLTRLGHSVSGLALDPLPGSLFERAELSPFLLHDYRGDIRDARIVQEAVSEASPDILIHLAAQPLVRESYRNPTVTMETNVLGTLNLLEVARRTSSLRAALVVTSDKVYRNDSRSEGYVETDPLGGSDPYSASKAMADILVQSWTQSFNICPVAIARAGNVIGGGDAGQERLLPDLLTAFSKGRPAAIRSPEAVRPWQHVLDCLYGYVLLVDRLLSGDSGTVWNFGPETASTASVSKVAERTASLWGSEATWETVASDSLHEAAVLTLNSSRSRDGLNWRDHLSLDAALEWTVTWTKEAKRIGNPLQVTQDQIDEYLTQVQDTNRL